MRIVPAVDIRGGLCVNLVQGDYDRETVFSDDPVAQAVHWHELGAALVHVVDLDGAKSGYCCVERQLQAMDAAGISFEVGGGIRDLATVRRVISAGAQRVILGTAAHRDPALIRRAAEEFPGRIVVGIDARDGKVALSGWYETTRTEATDFAQQAEAGGAGRIIFTDILSDGMMGGPNVAGTRALARSVSIPVTASGGVSSLQNIGDLRDAEEDGVDEIIVGRALYLGTFTLPRAMAAAGEDRP